MSEEKPPSGSGDEQPSTPDSNEPTGGGVGTPPLHSAEPFDPAKYTGQGPLPESIPPEEWERVREAAGTGQAGPGQGSGRGFSTIPSTATWPGDGTWKRRRHGRDNPLNEPSGAPEQDTQEPASGSGESVSLPEEEEE